MTQASWHNAALALRLLALDPQGLGGAVIRMRAGPDRDDLVSGFDGPYPVRKLPISISDAQLFGGLDLSATLGAARIVHSAGLFQSPLTAILPMAERCPPDLAAKLAGLMDRSETHGIIALDEGIEPDERCPDALADRFAFHIAPEGRKPSPAPFSDPGGAYVDRDAALTTLTVLAARFGIASLRAPTLAFHTARAHAQLHGRDTLCEGDMAVAATLVFAHRATIVPEQDDAGTPPPPPDNHPENEPDAAPDDSVDDTALPDADMMVTAVKAALPQGVLDGLVPQGTTRTSAGAGAGQKRTSNRRGRPLPSRPGRLDGSARIDLIATLRSAAPWQPIRRRQQPDKTGLLIRPGDIRVKRYREQSDRLLIFCVDASGSAAVSRLGEAKGAIELLLGDAYANRDHVALVAFRGTQAETLLPPTRSLVQTKRRLSALPGGGGTPLASGLQAALVLAGHARAKGLSPTVILLTDGRANIALDGSADRRQAGDDATQMAGAVRAQGIASLVIDMSNRPHPVLRTLGAAMGAPYIALPRADAHRLTGAVHAALNG